MSSAQSNISVSSNSKQQSSTESYMSHPCTPEIPDWYSTSTRPTSSQHGSRASFERFSGADCSTPATMETELSSAENLKRSSSSSRNESVEHTTDDEMFCMNNEIWLDSSQSETLGTAVRGEKSQSLSSYKLLQDVHKAKEKSARKQILNSITPVKQNPIKKFSKSKFLSVNGWNVEEERQSLLQAFEDCVYMDEGNYETFIIHKNLKCDRII